MTLRGHPHFKRRLRSISSLQPPGFRGADHGRSQHQKSEGETSPMPVLDAEVAVVGLGAMGSHALWRLASRGKDVIGFEQFHAGHPFGSTHGKTRLFRTLCLEHPGLVPMARRSLQLWRELEEQTDTSIVRLCGLL